MSTCSLICMEISDGEYKTVYCHCDGYLSHNGSILVNYYSDRKTVERLIQMGDLSSLAKKIDPDPSRPHSFNYDERQDDVCVFYGRDRKETGTVAQTLFFTELKGRESRKAYVYIFTLTNEWKYFRSGKTPKEIRDVKADLDIARTS